MQKIIKIFLVLAAMSALGGILSGMMAVGQSSFAGEKSPASYHQLGLGLFMLSAVLIICSTVLMYKYGWGSAKQDAAGK